jgi:hypothetical protein
MRISVATKYAVKKERERERKAAFPLELRKKTTTHAHKQRVLANPLNGTNQKHLDGLALRTRILKLAVLRITQISSGA